MRCSFSLAAAIASAAVFAAGPYADRVPGLRARLRRHRASRLPGRCDERLGWAKATYRVPEGVIVSGWRYLGDGSCRFEFTVPSGTTATVTWAGETKEYSGGTYVL